MAASGTARTSYCRACGAPPAGPDATFCGRCGASIAPARQAPFPVPGMPAAAFGPRAVAWLIDSTIVSLLLLPWSLVYAVRFASGEPGDNTVLVVVGLPVALIFALYTCIGNGGGATIGKRALGLRVVNADGMRIGYARGLARAFLAMMLANYTVGLSYLWAIWDGRKQTLHDKIVGSYVVRAAGRDARTEPRDTPSTLAPTA